MLNINIVHLLVNSKWYEMYKVIHFPEEMILSNPEASSPVLEDHPLNPNPASQWQSFFKVPCTLVYKVTVKCQQLTTSLCRTMTCCCRLTRMWEGCVLTWHFSSKPLPSPTWWWWGTPPWESLLKRGCTQEWLRSVMDNILSSLSFCQTSIVSFWLKFFISLKTLGLIMWKSK